MRRARKRDSKRCRLVFILACLFCFVGVWRALGFGIVETSVSQEFGRTTKASTEIRMGNAPKTSSTVMESSPPRHELLPAVTNSQLSCFSAEPSARSTAHQGLAGSSCSPDCFHGVQELLSCKQLSNRSRRPPIESACAKFVHSAKTMFDVGAKFIVKRYSVSKKKRFFSGLSGPESFHLERSALQRLEQTKSKCNVCEERHLPKLIRAATYFPEGDESLGMALLHSENDGEAIDKSTPAQEQFCAMAIEEVERQGQCMQKWLDCANVTHLDMRTKNFVIDESSKLTLIDFDFSAVDHKPLRKLTTRYHMPWERTGPAYFLRQLHKHRCKDGKVVASQQGRFKELDNICLLMNKRICKYCSGKTGEHDRCGKCAHTFPFDW